MLKAFRNKIYSGKTFYNSLIIKDNFLENSGFCRFLILF